eukprot:4928655-Alexandrium_andersonii.AAC.1
MEADGHRPAWPGPASTNKARSTKGLEAVTMARGRHQQAKQGQVQVGTRGCDESHGQPEEGDELDIEEQGHEERGQASAARSAQDCNGPSALTA